MSTSKPQACESILFIATPMFASPSLRIVMWRSRVSCGVAPKVAGFIARLRVCVSGKHHKRGKGWLPAGSCHPAVDARNTEKVSVPAPSLAAMCSPSLTAL